MAAPLSQLSLACFSTNIIRPLVFSTCKYSFQQCHVWRVHTQTANSHRQLRRRLFSALQDGSDFKDSRTEDKKQVYPWKLKMEEDPERTQKLFKLLRHKYDSKMTITLDSVLILLNRMKAERNSDERLRLSSKEYCYILNFFGEFMAAVHPERRTVELDKAWNTLLSCGMDLDQFLFASRLIVYNENGHQFDHLEILEEMKCCNVTPYIVTYQEILYRYCSVGDLDTARNVIQKMQQLKYPLTIFTFSSVIEGYFRASDPAAALHWFNKMQSFGFSPTTLTYRALFRGHAYCGNLEAIKQLMKKDNSIQNYMDAVKVLVERGFDDKAVQMMELIGPSEFYCKYFYQLLLRLVAMNRHDLAVKLMPYRTVTNLQSLVKAMASNQVPKEEIESYIQKWKAEGYTLHQILGRKSPAHVWRNAVVVPLDGSDIPERTTEGQSIASAVNQ